MATIQSTTTYTVNNLFFFSANCFLVVSNRSFHDSDNGLVERLEDGFLTALYSFNCHDSFEI